MIPWWAGVLIFYGGFVAGFVLAAILNANGRRSVADEAETWLRNR